MSLIETKHFTITAEKSWYCVQPKPEEAPDEKILSFQSWKSSLLWLYPNRQDVFAFHWISSAYSSRYTASLPFLAVCLGRWICPDYDNYDNGLPCSLPPYPFCLAPLQMQTHLKMYTSWQKKKWGKGPLELNWTSGKNMDRYLQRTICRSCSGGDRDVTMVSAFCGPGREWLLKSDETAPDPNGSRKCSHPRTTDHSTVNTQVPA